MKIDLNLRRIFSAVLVVAFALNQLSLTALAVADIKVGGPLPTDTTVVNNGNITNIETRTTVKNGTIGINSFDRFNVGQDDTVNLNLINAQNKLINLIFDSSASQINGVVNSYMNGSIGGNILFVNPNGFVVGKSGVFNVGSLTLMTPTVDVMNKLISKNSYDETRVDRLINFTFNDQNYLITGNEFQPYDLAPSNIDIAGKINSAKGIDLISGSEVNILNGAELNANMDFSTDASGNIIASARNLTSVVQNKTYPKNFAMQDGENIIIVASNKDVSQDKLSAIVNLNGKVNANGGDVVVRSEIFRTDKNGDAKSQVNIGSNANISANNVLVSAESKVSDFDSNIIGVSDLSKEFYYGYLGEIANFVTGDFVHIANADTSVNVEKGAIINATNDVVLDAKTDMDLSSGLLASVLPDVNFNFVSVNSNTQVRVKDGAEITAKNLDVDATTTLDLSTSTKTTNLADKKFKHNIGSYSVGVTTTKLKNSAVIENGAKLSVGDNIKVSAKTKSNHSDIVKNGFVPIVDKNRGSIGGAVSVIVSDVVNEAVMNADANISGALNVDAAYSGNIVSTVMGYSGGEGEDSPVLTFFRHFLSYDKIDNVITRSNSKYNNFDVAAAVGVGVNEVSSSAKIGDSTKSEKPTIKAGEIHVNSETIDNKSNLYVQAESENGATTTSGAFAVNYKDLTSNANAYGDFTLNGSGENALSITSNTEIIHPMAWLDWFETFKPFFEKDTWDKTFKAVKDHWDAIDTNGVGDYTQYLYAVQELSKLLDDGSFDLIIKSLDFNNLGAYGFFNTFAQSKASAKQRTGETKAMSGAIALALFNANSNASLDKNSNVVLQTPSNINISATSKNEIWTAATLMDLLNIKKLASGATARDGSAYGIGAAFSYSDSNVSATIGENVNIKKDSPSTKVGDVSVSAKEKGNYLTIAAGSSSPDETGLTGVIGMTILGNGKVRAGIDSNANIDARNLNVIASKEDNFINALVAFANGQESYGFGLSGVALTDSVESYIAGTINASENVNVKANYDKTIVNANANFGVAKDGSDAPIGEKAEDSVEDYYNFNELFNEEPDTGTSGYKWYNLIKKYKKKSEKINDLTQRFDKYYDYTRAANPDKNTKANAGGINLNLAVNEVKAQIKDGAKINAEKNVTVNASSRDSIVNTGAVVSANGKSGNGGTILADITNSNIEASIGNSEVNSKKDVSVKASEDYKLIAASAGIAVADDSAGAGNISSAVQANNVTAAIKDGAKINNQYDSDEQTVTVEAKVDSNTVKAVGALAIEKGSGANQKSSFGGTVDGDVVVNNINAYIKDSEVNATKSVDVNAINNDKFIVVDVAGSGATKGAAYGGTIGAYIAVNDINAYIENSKINTKAKMKSNDVNVKATSDFKEIAVVGTVAAGNKTGVGASIRVDAIVNDVNSYIKNSTVKALNKASITNSDSMSQISVAVAGAGSSNANAGAGVISILADVTEQNSYIENSDLTVGNLILDTDKNLDTIAVTGAIAVASKGNSIGASGYAVGVSHDINTYILNSNIVSENDIQMTSNYKQDLLSIIFGGAGGQGIAGSGALNVIVNNSSNNTYVENKNEKKNLFANKGKITVKSENDIDTVSVDGNVSVSTKNVSAGGAVSTIDYNSKVRAGIDGANVRAAKGIDVEAKASQKHISTVVGVSGGNSTAVEGSVDTIVMNQDVEAYLKNSDVKAGSDINVLADDNLDVISTAGAIAASASGASVGASVLTVTMNGSSKAYIEDSDFDNFEGTLGNLSVKSTQEDSFKGATISGSLGKTAIGGCIDTIVINKVIEAYAKGLKNINNSSFANAEVNAFSKTYLGHGTGQVSAATGGVGVGGSVGTFVLNKDVNAEIKDSTINSRDYIKNISNADIDILSVVLGFGGASSVSVNGAVSTQVLNTNVKSEINNSVLSAIGDVQNDSNVKTDLDMYIAAANGAGTAAIGGVVYSLVDNTTAKALIKNKTNIVSANKVLNTSKNDANYIATMFNASGAGNAAVNGNVSTFVLNSGSESIIDDSTISNSAQVNVLSQNIADTDVIMLQASGAGQAAANGGVNTIVSSKVAKSEINKSNITSSGNIEVKSSAKNDIDLTVVGGAGAGELAITGAVNTIVSSDSIDANIKESTLQTTVANNSQEDSGIILKAENSLGIYGHAGLLSGAGGVAAGGAIVTGVITNSVNAFVQNSDLIASNIILSSVVDETMGTSSNPFITIAVAGSGGASISGAVNTLVLNSSSNTKVKGKKTSGLVADNKLAISSDSNTNLFLTSGVGAVGSVGVGGTVSTVVINKTLNATAEDTILTANKVDIDTVAKDEITNVAVAGGLGVSGSVTGAINTTVISSNSNAGIKNSTVKADDVSVDANNKASYFNTTGAISGGATVGIGASVVTNVVGYNTSAYIDNSSVKAKNGTSNAKKISVKADAQTDYDLYAVSGGIAGAFALGGVVETNVVNNTVEAYVSGNVDGIHSDTLEVSAKDTVNFNGIAGTLSVGLGCGVGATVQTNSVTSSIISYIGGNISSSDIDVASEGVQNFNDLAVIGFAGGSFAIGGSSLVNMTEATSKAYIDKDSVVTSKDVKVDAKNTTTITETVGTMTIAQYAAVGASVGVNKIRNITEAFTGDNVTINTEKATFNANSVINAGTENNKLALISGSGSAGVSVAGTVLVNDIENKVASYIGKNNNITSTKELKLDAKDTVNIYETVGGMAVGLGGVGASVGVNTINDTVLAYIGTGTVIDGGDISVKSESNQNIQSDVLVMGVGIGSLNGGILHNSIGKTLSNAEANDLTGDDANTYNQAKNQADDILKASEDYKKDADDTFKQYFNNAADDASKVIADANKNINTSLGDANVSTNVNVSANNVSKKSSTFSLFTKSEKSGSSIASTDRNDTTSAFIDTGVVINAKDVVVSAKDTNILKLKLDGNSGGGLAIGVSSAVSNINTTVNAFVSNNVVIDSKGKIEINANSIDNQTSIVSAAAGGIITGSGSVSKINSNKTTNAYVLNSSILQAVEDLTISAISKGDIYSDASSGAYGGVNVGVTIADAIIKGNTKIDIGENVSLTSSNGKIEIKANETEKANAIAKAPSGGILSGSGAEITAKAGKTNTVKIGKNANIIAKEDINLSSIAKNEVIADSNARAYGGISAGGTKTVAEIEHVGGISIADADSEKNISGASVSIVSKAQNDIDAKTKAGAGAAVGVSGSGVYTKINSENKVYVGKNYKVNTGAYSLVATNSNSYKAYNDSSAYGAIGVTVGIIENYVKSIVNAESNADIVAKGPIEVVANNSIQKAAATNYDLYGGAGGIVGVGAANLKDTIVAETVASLGGNYAYSLGSFDNGYITVASQSDISVNEKVDVTAGGAIPVSDGIVSVNTDVKTETNISNKDIKTKSDDIYFLANTVLDLYTKSNVESTGMIAVAEGSSSANNNKAETNINIRPNVKSISGRDTYIQAVCDNSVQSYMYANTKGLVGAVGSSDAKANVKSTSTVTIASGTDLKSYDSMNVTALNTLSKADVVRDAKGTTRILFGIPITIKGSGHETLNVDNSAKIVLDGTLESGLGSNRKLIINSDGTFDAEGIDIPESEKVGEITSEDIDSDMEAYEKSREGEIKQVDDYIDVKKNIVNEANNQITEYEKEKSELVSKNQNYETAVDNANTIIKNNTDIENIDSITSAWDSAYTITKVQDSSGKITYIYSLKPEFKQALSGHESDENLSSVVDAYNNYDSNKTDANLNILKSSIEDLSQTKSNIQNSTASIKNTITDINSNIDCSNNAQLTSFISSTNDEISANKTTIDKYTSSINAANETISQANKEINAADSYKQNINAKYDDIIADLQKEKDKASMGAIPVLSLKVNDIYVRSGNTTITGKMTGSGSITAPGNKFTVDIINNGINDVVYGDIQIDRNATGLIIGSDIDSSITKTIKNEGNEYRISIKNTVDANDPSIKLNSENGYGDMVFTGNVENVRGLISFINNTGNVLSEGSITAKDLEIIVPNGGYTQKYNTSTSTVGGLNGDGAIIASGDINIASKIIDINGLIQSGSEIKSVTIPDFKVVKEGGKYYQIVNGTKTEMQKGSTDGYYYLNLEGNGQLDSELEMVKAYFKPDPNSTDMNNIAGDIHLFKAEIQGGNITLSGNIISTSNNGKIVLVNGYGHIDINNESGYNLVTSALNADAKIQGKLKINDFKFSETDKEGKSFDNVNQNMVEDENWLANNAGTYEASVGEDGTIKTSSKGQLSGNGSFGEKSSSKRDDGANVSQITYNPGDDAYIVEKAGSVEQGSYQEYVKRSWWTELWHGKLYRTVYYTVVHDPVYGVAKNPITIQFQGFDKPQINVTSRGSIVMDSSISALTGDVNLISSRGDILTNSLKNVISAENIGLRASGDVGSSLKPVQSAVYNNGTLSADADNIYINYPYSNISNVKLNAKGNAYLATSGGKLGGIDSIVNISADSLELVAENGDIDLNAVENENIDVSVNKIKARAKGDIALTNKNDLKISSIVSTSKGKISLTSQNGSIIAADDTLNPYNINGGDVILSALNGYVGTAENNIKLARDGVVKVYAKNDVNLYSAGRIYADLISSKLGKVNLNADYGIIAAKSSDSLVYNIYSATGVDLNSKYGNIENIAINTDGIINASAGYLNGTASNMSDISISLISKEELSQEYIDSLASDEERQNALNNYVDGLKDMKLGTIQASKNVFIHSEKSILNASSSSSIKGENIVLSAGKGDIGMDSSAINVDANKGVTALAGNGSSVYLTSDGNLNINEIRSFNDSSENDSLANVVLTSAKNITSSDADKVNVKADKISLKAGEDVGSKIKHLNVETKNTGLDVSAKNAYIKGNQLNIISAVIDNEANFASDGKITAGDITSKIFNVDSKDVEIKGKVSAENTVINATNQTLLSNAEIGGDLSITSNELIVDNAELKNLTSSSQTADIINMTVKEDANISTVGKTTIADAKVGGNFTNTSESNEVTGTLEVTGDAQINAVVSASIANAVVGKNLDLNAKDVLVSDMTVKENANISTVGKTTIADAKVGGNFTNTSESSEVTGTLEVAGDAQINAVVSASVANAVVGKNLDLNAKDVLVSDMTVIGNVNSKSDRLNIKSSEDINIGIISGYSDKYTEIANIASDKSLNNGLSSGESNMYVKITDLKAGNSIGSEKNPLRLMLTEDNKISLKSGDTVSILTDGASANYGDIDVGTLAINSDKDIIIDKIKVKNLKVKTTSNNLTINNMVIEETAILDVGDKHIVVNNTSIMPIIDADVQLYLAKTPAMIKVDGSNNIITNAENVTRKNSDLSINGETIYGSMDDAISTYGAIAVKNTKVGDRTIEKTDKMLYDIPTQKAYENISLKDSNVIKNQIEEYITPDNAMEVINLTEAEKNIILKNKVSKRVNKNKLSSL